MEIVNFQFLGIDVPIYYLNQKYFFMIIIGMEKRWKFIIFGFWVLMHPSITSVKNILLKIFKNIFVIGLYCIIVLYVYLPAFLAVLYMCL